MLCPDARITPRDIDPAFWTARRNKSPRVRFVAGDATRPPFEDGSFDMVTMVVLLEHVEVDAAVARAALAFCDPAAGSS